jgi:serine/threonine protein kinase
VKTCPVGKSAIKVMNPAMVHDPDAVARFNRGAANASRISHANVCAIYDFGETPARLDDRTKACQYARESARLDPGNNPYQVLQNSLCQP